MKRYHIIVEGRVQGVGFRTFATLEAQKRKLTGSVRNLSNGMVEIFVQGEEEKIDMFLSAVRAGNTWIRVDDLTIKEKPIVPGEQGFKYGW